MRVGEVRLGPHAIGKGWLYIDNQQEHRQQHDKERIQLACQHGIQLQSTESLAHLRQGVYCNVSSIVYIII